MTQRRNQALENAIVFLEILRNIPRRQYTTSAHLHAQLTATGHVLARRTLQRYLDLLIEHFPIECDTRSKPYGYRWLKGSLGLSVPLLTPAEALLLELAQRQMAELLPQRTLAALAPLFASAEHQLFNNQRATSERGWVHKVARIPDSLPQLPPLLEKEMLETISEALLQEHSLHLSYHNARGIGSKTAHVYPLSLVQQGTRLYLVCRFEGYTNERILALARISEAQPGTPFTYPADFNLSDYIDAGHFGVRRGPEVRLSFCIDPTIGQHVIESSLSHDQTVEVRENAFHITATVTDTQLLRRWLRGWGDAVWDVCIEPAERRAGETNAVAPDRYSGIKHRHR